MSANANRRVFERLQIELRILSDIARRVEYAMVDELIQNGEQENRANIQLLDLLIQSTEALDKVMGRVATEFENGEVIEPEVLAHGLPLRDMANRLRGGSQALTNTDASIASSVDLF